MVLDIRLTESEKDWEDFWSLLSHARDEDFAFVKREVADRRRESYSAIARVGGVPIGFWTGFANAVPFSVVPVFKSPLFWSNYFFVLREEGNKGYGFAIKKNQLEFARDLGHKSSACRVEYWNEESMRIQEKLGAKFFEERETRLCYFDFEELNL